MKKYIVLFALAAFAVGTQAGEECCASKKAAAAKACDSTKTVASAKACDATQTAAKGACSAKKVAFKAKATAKGGYVRG